MSLLSRIDELRVHSRLSRVALGVALVVVLVLFVAQQIYYEIADARHDATSSASSILAFMHVGQEQGLLERTELLAEAAQRVKEISFARYCDAKGCVAFKETPVVHDCHGGSTWDSLCVAVASAGQRRDALEIRYSLRQAHEATLRDVAFFAAILAIGSLVARVGSRRLRTRVQNAEALLVHAAAHDALTTLPNRSAFESSASKHLAGRQGHERLGALLFLDMDGFKEINDRFGHHVGDEVLRAVGKRIRTALDDGDIVGRLGGDEFGVLIPAGNDQRHIDRKAAELIRLLSQPVDIDGRLLPVGVSIGATTLDRDSISVDEALRRADVALHEVKRTSRGGLLYFNPHMDEKARLRYEFQAELQVAIPAGQLFLEYQPQVDAAGELRGVEALVRWRHPARGLIRPDAFISIAEESGLIVALGLRVLDMACTDLLRTRACGMMMPYVSVNVSPKQLTHPTLHGDIISILQGHGLGPRDIELEVTESSLMESRHAEETIRRLAQSGFRIAIDDFGTGYSSLSRLHNLPVHKLKIDRSFVLQLGDGGRGMIIAQSILDLAKRMRIKTVAEGVETEEQAAWLRSAGCDLLQGYLFARPLPIGALLKWPSSQLTSSIDRFPTWNETEPAVQM